MDIAERALEFVKDGDVVGLGSGRAAIAFVRALGERVAEGLRVRGVPTSKETERVAAEAKIPLAALAEVQRLEVTVDGADEVDPRLDLIKGYGAALVREKIVASASDRLVILVGSEKLVPALGTRGRLPIEVVPFGLAVVRRRLTELGFASTVRADGGAAVVTDNGNHILDCAVSALDDPAAIDRLILELPGVVGTGLFLGMADTVLVQNGKSVEVRRRGANA